MSQIFAVLFHFIFITAETHLYVWAKNNFSHISTRHLDIMSFGNLPDNILVQLIVQHLNINRQKASDTNTEIVLSPFTQLHADTVILLENFSHCDSWFWSYILFLYHLLAGKKLVWQQWHHIQGISWRPNLSAQMCRTPIIQAFKGSSKPPPLALKDSSQRWHWQRPR